MKLLTKFFIYSHVVLTSLFLSLYPISEQKSLYQTAPAAAKSFATIAKFVTSKASHPQSPLMGTTPLTQEARDRKILEDLTSPFMDPETGEVKPNTSDVNTPIAIDPEGHQVTPLALAAFWGWADLIDVLYSKGAHVNAFMPTNTLEAWQGYTALHIAVAFNRVDTVKALIINKADINAKINSSTSPFNGLTPLDLAIGYGHKEIALLLNQVGAERTLVPQDESMRELIITRQQQIQATPQINAEAIDLEGQTELIKAIRAGNSALVQELVAKGSNPNKPIQGLEYNKNPLTGFSPLCFAIYLGHNQIASILLQFGANPNYVITNNDAGKNGFCPLHIAVAKNNAEMVTSLIKRGADIEAPIQAPLCLTPLCLAAECGYPEIINILCESGAHVNHTLDGFTPLHHAIMKKQPLAIKVLIKHNADPNILVQKPHNPYDGFNGLCLAILHNDLIGFACLRIILKAKGNYKHIISVPPYQDFNAMKLAIKRGNIYAIKALVGAGAQVNPTIHAFVEQCKATLPSETYVAVQEYLAKAVISQRLLRICEDFRKLFIELITLQQQDMSTPIEKSAPDKVANIAGLFKTIEDLLIMGADVNIKDRNGLSPLHLAIYHTNPVKSTISDKLASLLLEHEADPNNITLDGLSPLNLAITNGNVRLIKELLDKGADPDPQIGQKPSDVAQKTEIPEIIKMIEKALKEKYKHSSKFKKLWATFKS